MTVAESIKINCEHDMTPLIYVTLENMSCTLYSYMFAYNLMLKFPILILGHDELLLCFKGLWQSSITMYTIIHSFLPLWCQNVKFIQYGQCAQPKTYLS